MSEKYKLILDHQLLLFLFKTNNLNKQDLNQIFELACTEGYTGDVKFLLTKTGCDSSVNNNQVKKFIELNKMTKKLKTDDYFVYLKAKESWESKKPQKQ